MDDMQREDAQRVFADIKSGGLLDFVAAWYVKAARYMTTPSPALTGTLPRAGGGNAEPLSLDGITSDLAGVVGQPSRMASSSIRGAGERVKAAFVSTNSITQGEQAGVLWGWLLAQGIRIHFAHRTFQWSNEAKGVAAVHCVIIGFGAHDVEKKVIYEYEDIRGEAHAVAARNINPYLVDAPDVNISNRRQPILPVPEIVFGNMPNDGGHLLMNDAEKHELLLKEPAAEKYIRPFMSAKEFINNEPRWCLWLVNVAPHELRQLPEISRRVQAVKQLREASDRSTTRELASFPTLFGEVRQPSNRYLAIPKTSSERRNFIPIAFLDATCIASTELFTIDAATLYHFGILTSTMHMAWVRYTCGRMKSDYRYSAGIVYNNFPWPDEPSDKQRAAVEVAAQAVLDARAQFPQSSLADLYDPLTMPPALVKAHQALDRAVDACYRKAAFASDAQRVEFLFERYQQLTSLLPTEKTVKARKRKAQAC